MTHCCSQCSFTAQFESALKMHHQLHHENKHTSAPKINSPRLLQEKTMTYPLPSPAKGIDPKSQKGAISLGRTSSATRIFGMLRSKISKSKVLFSHAEERFRPGDAPSECTSNIMNESFVSEEKEIGSKEPAQETFACHLCSFDADRITALDRHLLNYHKIGLENLLKLVMAKTRDGLSEEEPNPALYGLRQPYYKPQDEIIEVGDFVMETVTSKVKILRNVSTNTDITLQDFPNLNDVQNVTKELQNLKSPADVPCDKDDLLMKMQTLSQYMCKYADSSNALKKLTKEFGSKYSIREAKANDEPFLDIDMGDQDRASWEKSRSERFASHRHRFDDGVRSDKTKLNSDSFFF